MGRRVLVVDDNTDAADLLAALLKYHTHEVRVAYCGEAALELAQSFQPAVVLLDIGMPGMDGVETARRMRALPDCGGIRVIALTAWGNALTRRRLADAGFERHLVKPAPIETVLAAIEDAA